MNVMRMRELLSGITGLIVVVGGLAGCSSSNGTSRTDAGTDAGGAGSPDDGSSKNEDSGKADSGKSGKGDSGSADASSKEDSGTDGGSDASNDAGCQIDEGGTCLCADAQPACGLLCCGSNACCDSTGQCEDFLDALVGTWNDCVCQWTISKGGAGVYTCSDGESGTFSVTATGQLSSQGTGPGATGTISASGTLSGSPCAGSLTWSYTYLSLRTKERQPLAAVRLRAPIRQVKIPPADHMSDLIKGGSSIKSTLSGIWRWS
jgi:hypothetical protein